MAEGERVNQRKRAVIGGRGTGVQPLESRRLMSAGNIVVNSQGYEPLRVYGPKGVLLRATGTVPTQSSAGAGDGGSAGAVTVDASNDVQLFTGGFSPFLQRHNGPITGSGDAWTTEATATNTPGWSLVGRTFYGGLAAFGQYVFATDMATGSGGGANGLIRFDAKGGYAPTRFASGVDYSDVSLGMDGNLYGLVSPAGQPSSGTVNVFNPTTLKVVRTIALTDADDACVVADAAGNIYTGAFGGVTNKVSPAGKVLATAAIAATDLSISTDGKIVSCEGNHVRVLDTNLNVLSGFNVDSPYGAVFATWDTYQAPPAAATTTTPVSGTVFADANVDGKLTAGEKGLANVRVYVDADKSGSYKSTDVSVLTSSTGAFTLALAAGTYRLRQVLPSGDVATAPTAGYVDETVKTSAVTGVAFADAPATASVAGTVYVDFNANGKRDANDFGLGLWTLQLTYTSGVFKGRTATTTTAGDGTFKFAALTAGTYTIRCVPPTSGTTPTKPTGNVLNLTLAAGAASTGNLFGEV